MWHKLKPMKFIKEDKEESSEEKIFIKSLDNNKTYGDLRKNILYNLDNLKIQNIQSGEVVAIIGDYCFETISLFFALHLNKCIVVPITNTLELEIDYRIKAAQIKYAFYLQSDLTFKRKEYQHQNINKLVENFNTKKNSGLILFSSGSSGVPKAMLHNLDFLIDSYSDKKSKKLTFLIFLLFDHIGGINTLLNAIAMGCSIVIPESRDPEYISSLIEKLQINILPSSPTFLNLILMSKAHRKYSFNSLRLITYGTEPMPDELLKRLKAELPNIKLIQTFGTSETGIANVLSKSSSSNFIKFDDPNCEYKIVEGELWLRSKTQILGYLNSTNEKFTSDGWFKTGDLVEESEGGFLRISGRSTDLINVGGLKVLPDEVESVLLEIEGIKDALVFSKKNPITGEIVAAQVVIDENIIDKNLLKSIIRSYCSKKLDSYKIPVYIEKVDSVNFSSRYKKNRLLN
jgi:acyl-CoA synthetase (AMP-forming)/AMP-acid ligase II